MSMKHLVKTRTYRERSQPAARQHMGLLEKHKDYVLRAKDFHRKEDALQKLREKASFRNPDEYYMKMSRTKTEDGVHRKERPDQPTMDEMRVFKKEDAGYLLVKQTAEARKIERLRANLHMLDAPLQNKHTVFAADATEARSLDASRHGSTPAEAAALPPVRKPKKKKRGREAAEADAEAAEGKKQKVGEEASTAAMGEEADSEEEEEAVAFGSALAALNKKQRERLEKARAKQYAELEQRVERHTKMGRALERISMEKALMGKGPRRKLKPKVEGAPKAFKWKQIDHGCRV